MERKKIKIFLFIIIIIILTTLSLIPNSGIKTPVSNDKVLHFLAYIFLSCMADFLLNKKALITIGILFAYGVLIEFVQYYLPFRQFELLDIAANTAGIIVFFCFKYILTKAKIQNFHN